MSSDNANPNHHNNFDQPEHDSFGLPLDECTAREVLYLEQHVLHNHNAQHSSSWQPTSSSSMATAMTSSALSNAASSSVSFRRADLGGLPPPESAEVVPCISEQHKKHLHPVPLQHDYVDPMKLAAKNSDNSDVQVGRDPIDVIAQHPCHFESMVGLEVYLIKATNLKGCRERGIVVASLDKL
jgi:hypothetical protein